MTTQVTNSTKTGKDRDQQFVQRLLRQRRDENAAARSALRRGDTAALADRAIPYLDAWHFKHDEIPPALLFAAAACRYTDIADDPHSPLGRAAFDTLSKADRREPASTSVGRRFVAAQRQALPLAHRTFLGLLTSIAAHPRVGLDWTGLWRLYRTWDHPEPQYRRATRRQLLLDFYGTNPTADTDNTEPDNAHDATTG